LDVNEQLPIPQPGRPVGRWREEGSSGFLALLLGLVDVAGRGSSHKKSKKVATATKELHLTTSQTNRSKTHIACFIATFLALAVLPRPKDSNVFAWCLVKGPARILLVSTLCFLNFLRRSVLLEFSPFRVSGLEDLPREAPLQCSDLRKDPHHIVTLVSQRLS